MESPAKTYIKRKNKERGKEKKGHYLFSFKHYTSWFMIYTTDEGRPSQ